MAFYKFNNAEGLATYASSEDVPDGATIMTEAKWRSERDATMRLANVTVLEAVAAIRPVSLFAARKVLRDTKAADGKSYMEKIKAARAAGDLSDDAADALEMLDPVSQSSPWVAEIKTLFGLSEADVTALFAAMRAVRV